MCVYTFHLIKAYRQYGSYLVNRLTVRIDKLSAVSGSQKMITRLTRSSWRAQTCAFKYTTQQLHNTKPHIPFRRRIEATHASLFVIICSQALMKYLWYAVMAGKHWNEKYIHARARRPENMTLTCQVSRAVRRGCLSPWTWKHNMSLGDKQGQGRTSKIL